MIKISLRSALDFGFAKHTAMFPAAAVVVVSGNGREICNPHTHTHTEI